MTASTLFTNNRSQAVRLPADMRYPNHIKKVEIRAIGIERIIVPSDSVWDSFFIGGPEISNDFLSERASQEQSGRETF